MMTVSRKILLSKTWMHNGTFSKTIRRQIQSRSSSVLCRKKFLAFTLRSDSRPSVFGNETLWTSTHLSIGALRTEMLTSTVTFTMILLSVPPLLILDLRSCVHDRVNLCKRMPCSRPTACTWRYHPKLNIGNARKPFGNAANKVPSQIWACTRNFYVGRPSLRNIET